MSPGSWLEELEARLNQQLESFLRTNPQQEALLAEQAQRDRQQRLLHERLKLRQEAELQRQGLLRLAGEIRQWQERSERARGAGAEELAARAEAHIATLMEQGRNRWQTLAELGERFAVVERELAELTAAPTPPAPGRSGERVADGMAELEQDWRRFEAQQELEALRRRNQS
ncbi:MAG: hercynine metabolism protein [Cyanobium sp. ELA712]|jgi:hercynine metabolism protein